MQPFLYKLATDIQPGNLPNSDVNSSTIKTILGIVFGIVGALALLMLVVSGLRYVISGGDPNRISKAKDGIIFALIGLLIALTAEAIVAFVVNKL
jgi:CDP-diglyceride synthetase